ncbi:efflux RND transporter periplasmic adaptor subunit [Thalassomonas sp. M1454]|uniref:efflux RND transporter periplasmic adaptor subunit n=1 Tax=Thalassomonas sp. M1454 TaxID=2594477 RepID=UPI00117F70C2|nr:efflux RND transporter periplasmic adaptor subunit [Thalassomonas sp. M1454]TRX56618.1 efflux RND transporter periplasmic adaptor subunit [Thalassomonas sp. M1454]
MKKFILPSTAIAILLIAIAYMAGMFDQKIQPITRVLVDENINKPFTIKSKSVDVIESLPAGVKARETTLISSRILSRIEKIYVRAGDSVNTGDLLISLENSEFKAREAQAQAQISSVTASREEAKKTLDRSKELQTKGLISTSELDKAVASYSKLSAELNAAKQYLKEAETALTYTDIRAPISGKIVERNAEPGDISSPGTPVLSLYNPSSLRIEANVRESLAVKLQLSEDVRINIDSIELELNAKITEIVPAADPNARSFVIKADIDFNESILPGMFARINIQNGLQKQILIPKNYIQSFGQLDTVWVVDGEQLQRRYIRTGKVYGEMIQIISGLQDNEVIAIKH